MLKLFRGRLIYFCLHFSLSLSPSFSLFPSSQSFLSFRHSMRIAVAVERAGDRSLLRHYRESTRSRVSFRVNHVCASPTREVPEPERRATTMRALVFARASSRKKGCTCSDREALPLRSNMPPRGANRLFLRGR